MSGQAGGMGGIGGKIAGWSRERSASRWVSGVGAITDVKPLARPDHRRDHGRAEE